MEKTPQWLVREQSGPKKSPWPENPNWNPFSGMSNPIDGVRQQFAALNGGKGGNPLTLGPMTPLSQLMPQNPNWNPIAAHPSDMRTMGVAGAIGVLNDGKGGHIPFGNDGKGYYTSDVAAAVKQLGSLAGGFGDGWATYNPNRKDK